MFPQYSNAVRRSLQNLLFLLPSISWKPKCFQTLALYCGGIMLLVMLTMLASVCFSHCDCLYRRNATVPNSKVAHTDLRTDFVEQCASHSHLGPGSTELLGKPTFQRQPSVCRVKTPSRGDQSDLSMLWSSQSGSVCLKQEHSVVHALFLERLHYVLLYVLPIVGKGRSLRLAM